MAENGKRRSLTGTTTPAIANKIKLSMPRPVVSPELMDENVAMRNAWVGTLREKRYISTAMTGMKKILPGICHLKRCFGNRLVLGFSEPADDDECQRSDDLYYPSLELVKNLLTTNGFDLSIFHDEFEIVRVPARQPRTKAQARIAGLSWPINFHPDPSVELILTGCWFDNEKLYTIDRCMRACIEASLRQSRGNEECNGSALAYDPVKKKIMGIAASRIDRHPMWHASILVVDLVARLNNGGAYESMLSTNDQIGVSYENRKRKLNNERFVPAYPTDLADVLRNFECSSCIDESVTSGSGGYLCTDYWIFLLREPCPLCAMALVHSRVSNVFYGVPNEFRGVLGSKALLHATPGLNHRYRVWRGVCEQDCRRTFNEISKR